MSRIVFAAAMIASLLALAKHERALDRTGLLGTCATVAAPAPGRLGVARVPPRRADGVPRPRQGLVHAARDAR